MQHIKYARDFSPTESLVIVNLVVAAISFLFGIQIVRIGERWQRIVGYCICAYPVYVLLEHAAWGFNVVSR